ncbi:YslB family protein [Halobacillus amylolyticus]|uniref:YslB family protein n=1 Tax=Halobacillus amylolyticus TaxID=2932259 RepID=A0ABY4HAY9_9BACI|nr:YslB family protein [Halobacillus amylolyticus]UOR11992.1 YslB family protein [Halobacillus amylolyticus]
MRETAKLSTDNISSLVATGAGFDLLRYYTLPDFLGKDAPYLLYYMGKNIARETTLTTWDELYEFFQYMGWGELTLIKEKKKEIIFQLKGHIIEKRLNQKLFQVDFRLECGFLAQIIQVITSDTYECVEEKHVKDSMVEITAIKG